MIDMEKFAKRLAALRRERGYTGEGLAQRLQVSPQAVSKWENGRSLPLPRPHRRGKNGAGKSPGLQHRFSAAARGAVDSGSGLYGRADADPGDTVCEQYGAGQQAEYPGEYTVDRSRS